MDLTCNPGNVTIGTTNYALPGLVPGNGNRCDTARNATLYPDEVRNSIFSGISFNIGGAVSGDIKGFFTHREDAGNGGPLTATAGIGPNSPYYESTTDGNEIGRAHV